MVTARSSIPSIAASMAARAGRSRRSSGSPPVSRTSRTPSDARTETTRRISSKVRMRFLGNQPTPVAGMQ